MCSFCRQEEAESLGLPAEGGEAEGALAAAAPLALACWRGRASLNILVAKPDCAQLAEKLRYAAKRKAGSRHMGHGIACMRKLRNMLNHLHNTAARLAHGVMCNDLSPEPACCRLGHRRR